MIRKLGIALVALLGLWLAQAGLLPGSVAEAAPARNLGVASAQCDGGGYVTVNLQWTPGGDGIVEWVDLTSLSNGFQFGIFAGWGPLAGNQNSLSWPGLFPNTTYYVRVNTLTNAGWQASPTIAFTTGNCSSAYPGATNLSVAQQVCQTGGFVQANLTWTPSGQGIEFVDLTSLSNGFVIGAYAGWGPLAPSANALGWPGLYPGTTYYVRVNTLTVSGWWPSTTLSFTTRSDCQQGGGQAAMQLKLSTQACQTASYAQATFTWTPSGAGQQWVELTSLNTNFAAGTYASWGALASSVNTLTWPGLFPNTTYYVRVNTLTAAGFVPSASISFTTPDCAPQYGLGTRTVDGNAVAMDPALLTNVAIGAHTADDFDRIVFQFAGDMPDATVQYVNSISQCGSGMPVDPMGDFIISVRMTPAEAHTGTGPTVSATIAGTGIEILEAKQVCDFEGVVTWAVGVKLKNGFKVTVLSGPNRIVIDVLQ